MSPAELWTVLKDAYAFHRRAWFIHFEVMYVLTANYLAFYALAEEIGLSGSQVSSFLSGPADVLQPDRRGAVAAGRARAVARRGRGADAAGRPPTCARGCSRCPAARRGWPSSTRSWRSTGSGPRRPAGSTRPSWIEDPSPALYSIGTFLAKPAGFDFHAARAAAVAERDAQIDQARRSVNGADLTRFNEALASNQAANFAWWNEEHNYLIDRRAAIPVRRATLELGARLADAGRISRPEDMFFLFKPELFDVMESGGTDAAAGRS